MNRKLVTAVILLSFSSLAMAQSLGQISMGLMGPMGVLSKIVLFVSIICGVAFFLGSMIQYKYHRENPQQVKISTPILMFLLSLVLMGFPLLLIYTGSVPWLSGQ